MIPARNEAPNIVRTIESVNTAREHLHRSDEGTTSNLVVVADACTDATAAVARRRLSSVDDRVVDSSAGCVGVARLLGTELGLVDTPHQPSRLWIANTDADTVVPPDWLEKQLSIARTGAVGIAGIVDLDRRSLVDAELATRFRRSYTLGRDGTHHHVHGANLSFRADAYREVGGWSPVPTGEDHDLWDRLQRLGPVVSTIDVVVHTAGRLDGRAPAGFANDLIELAGEPA